jgi:hypothetical protein
MPTIQRSFLTSALLITVAFLATTGFQNLQSKVPVAIEGGDREPGRTAVLRTDKTHYAPGEVVILTSSGWTAGETVTLLVHEEPMIHPDRRLVLRADGAGELFDNELVAHGHEGPVAYSVAAKGESSGLTALAAFGNTAVNLDQCSNGSTGTAACTGNAWQNGNLNSNQAKYFEGQSIPYRDVFTGVSAGVTYTKTISWDTTKDGKHAVDYLTSWNRNVAAGSSPCAGVLTPCPGSPLSAVVPADPDLSANGFDGTQIAGSFLCYGCSTLTVGDYALSGSYSGDSTRSLTITFTATGPNAVIAWGGHISDRRDWGNDKSAVTIPGSPYHMADVAFTCNPGRCSTGKQDRSISAEAVVFPGQITVNKDVEPDGPGVFEFTTTGGLTPSTFSLDDDSATALSNSREFIGVTTFGQYTVTETDPAPFSLTAVACTDDVTGDPVGSGDTATRTATFTLAEGQGVTCTFTNSVPPDCTTDADCTAEAPKCDITAKKCVQCLADAECSGATPICNQNHSCEPCDSDEDCSGSTPACTTSGPLAGTCTQCSPTDTSLCGASTPVCDSTDGACVACVTNADCSGATPVCNANHTCEPCDSDEDCSGSTPACTTSGPLAGTCTQCSPTDTSLCGASAPVCDSTDGACVACITNADCSGATPICNQNNSCEPCDSDEDCSGSTPACTTSGPLAGTCTQCSPTDTTLCGASAPVCDSTDGACVACVTNADCTDSAAPVCNQESHICGSCSTDAECAAIDPSAPACLPSGTCGQCSPTNSTLCTGDRPVCNTQEALCVGCNTSEDCGDAAPNCDSSTHECKQCLQDSDCTNGVCDEPTGSCIECVLNEDCAAAAPVCNSSTHTCGDCTADADCSSFGDSPFCGDAGSCVGCLTNENCDGGQVCNDSGTCETPPPHEGKIAPTATTCEQFRTGTATDLNAVLYGVKANKINNVAPGVLFYYTHVDDLSAGGNTIQVLQTRQLASGDPITPFLGVHQSQVSVYNGADCSTSTLRPQVTTSADGQTVTIAVTGAAAGQDLIVGIKYNPGSVVGTNVSAIRPVVHYNFVTSLNGVTGETDPNGLDLQPKP